MKPMTEEHFAILRRHMVELIAVHVDLMSEELGKALLHERVLSAMLRIPRHLFVPPELAAFSYQDTRYRSALEKRSHSPSSARL